MRRFTTFDESQIEAAGWLLWIAVFLGALALALVLTTAAAGGTIAFADGVNLASQIGRTFHLFDWTGVAPIGEFNIVSPFLWDASRLYSAGEITMVGVPEGSSVTLLALALLSLLLRRFR
jgi:hypothetical protein